MQRYESKNLSATVRAMNALLDTRALSEQLLIPESTLDQWAYLGKGPVYLKIGRHRRYRPEDVEAWLDANRHDKAAT